MARIALSSFVCGAILLSSLTGISCGYRFATRSVPGIPPSIQTIAIPAFRNETFQFKLEQNLTAAVIQEFLSRSSYRVQSSEAGSDAVLRGVVATIYSSPIVFDPTDGRTTKVLMTVGLRVTIQDTKTGQIVYEANDLVFREAYEVSSDPRLYFGENQPALERLSRQVAASLVSTLLEGF